MKTIVDLWGRKIGIVVLVIAAGLLVSLAQLPVYASSGSSPTASCTPNFILSTSRPITNNTRGAESVLEISITSLCGLSGSVGWDVALTAPSHTATNAPILHQPTYRVNLSPNHTSGFEFTAITSQNTLLTAWTITVTAFGLGLRHTLNVTLTVNDFTIAANPTHITVKPGQVATSAVTATGINGFSGQIFYSGLLSPSSTPSEDCNLQPAQPTLRSTVTSVTSILSCSFTAKGTYTMFESATLDSGSPSRNATITMTVP
jgi:hypothetical protein